MTLSRVEDYAKRLLQAGYIFDMQKGHIYTPKGKMAGHMRRNGFYYLSFKDEKGCISFPEHKLVWCMAYGCIPGWQEIAHINGDVGDNHLVNLKAMSRADYNEYVHAPRERGLSDADGALLKQLLKGWYEPEEEQIKAALQYDDGKNIVGRVVEAVRNGVALRPGAVLALYPFIVMSTMNYELDADEQIKNAAMGIAGECGEIVDIIKKHYFQGHELDVNHTIEEVGDLMYYITVLLVKLRIDISDVFMANMDKLNTRYPVGFSADRSINRDKGE
ncbi:MAG: HNH endonuclease [Lachnospiraceae bacterium]|nr:HNH endonuclease [Lachnospiraceae bacterium]